MKRAYYSDDIQQFRVTPTTEIVGTLVQNSQFDVLQTQRDAWLCQIALLQDVLTKFEGRILLEFDIPRMGRRIDAVLLIQNAIFVVEFKVGADSFVRADIDQTVDYALDLHNFHEASHSASILPILVATNSKPIQLDKFYQSQNQVSSLVRSSGENLSEIVQQYLSRTDGENIDPEKWEASSYKPTPTIIEATLALYNNHDVTEISRNDAGARNLLKTSSYIDEVIHQSKANSEKSIVFVTGVPGAGKTLVGLNVATSHSDPDDDCYCVFLSGNGPLVAILREALARDKVRRATEEGEKLSKSSARNEVKALIQNVHHFRDAGLLDDKPPADHIAMFDEAQRAWDREQTAMFMKQKKGIANFDSSEPEFLISCMDRHRDWAVIVCLVGGGQEINRGEAGIAGWIDAVTQKYPNWRVYASDQLIDSEYGDAGAAIGNLLALEKANVDRDLHLKSSMRSFRNESVSKLVKQILDFDADASNTLKRVSESYPIVITRSVSEGRDWLRLKARGSERYGIMVSSQAERLRPVGLHVKAPIDPVKWFLDDKSSVRSSYYLEEVATEFHVQGLELDWACVVWDADFRIHDGGWENWSFRGNKWQRIKKEERKRYQLNAYRVLLTRARQGMVIVVPEGSASDPTRSPKFYDKTFEYLSKLGIQQI